jgi:hypothetical protein
MNMQPDDESIDHLLADSMRRRPIPSAPARLAEIAHQRAMQQERAAGERVLRRRQRLGFVVNLGAALVLIAVFAVAVVQVWPEGSASNLQELSVVDSVSDASSDDDALLLTAAALLGGILLVCVERVLSVDSNRPLMLNLRRLSAAR